LCSIAFVKFADKASLEKAVKLSGQELDGRTLRINKSSDGKQGGDGAGGRPSFGAAGGRGGAQAGGRPSFGGGSSAGSPSKTLMVRGLSYQADTSALETSFSEAEGFASARVATDRESGQSRGFGFVEFESADAAAKALADYDGLDIGGRPVKLAFAEERYVCACAGVPWSGPV
jgi:nucleolin